MYKKILSASLIIGILTTSSITSFAHPANRMNYDNLYPKTAIIVALDNDKDMVTVNDGYNNWQFTGIEDLQMYDTVSMIMDNNGTKTVTDDKIVCEQASSIDLYNN